jgi:hypothetical protein
MKMSDELYVNESGDFRRFNSYRMRELGIPEGYRPATAIEQSLFEKIEALSGDRLQSEAAHQPEAYSPEPWPEGKLFVWVSPYPVNYGRSLYFAVAKDVEEARKLAAGKKIWAYSEYDNDKAPETVKGEPTRVLDLPCGEWHEWSE